VEHAALHQRGKSSIAQQAQADIKTIRYALTVIVNVNRFLIGGKNGS
jgi:hypothetical protein